MSDQWRFDDLGDEAAKNTENGASQSEASADAANPNKQDNSEPDMEPSNNSEPKYDYYQFKNSENSTPPQNEDNGPGKKFAMAAGIAAVFGLIAGGTFFGVNAIGNILTNGSQGEISENFSGNSPGNNTITAMEPETSYNSPGNKLLPVDGEQSPGEISSYKALHEGEYSVAQVVERCMPTIVSITNLGVEEVQSFFGGVQQYKTEGAGSGIIVGKNEAELLIATNNHVVSGAKTLTVAFCDDKAVSAQIKGTDSKNDLAIISVSLSELSDETKNAITIASLGNSDALVVGEQVVAIGNALGYGQSVTGGYVSALNRKVEVDNVSSSLIQTDAAINPGNSGGALLNLKGEVIGINSVKFASSQVEGMGYAIPISTAYPILSELMNKKTRQKVDEDKAGYLGITCYDVSKEVAETYKFPEGVYVKSVEEDSGAKKAGLKEGDIITQVDGSGVYSSKELVGLLEYYAAGETIKVEYYRSDNGEWKSSVVDVTLGNRPVSGELDSVPKDSSGINDFDNRDSSDLDDFFGFELPGQN